VAAKGLSVRETEALVRRLNQPPAPRPTDLAEEDPDVRRLVADLTDKLGARVALQQGSGGKGRLVISYNTLEELEGILAHIQ
jgi:ParB family chromosome partitioning protein